MTLQEILAPMTDEEKREFIASEIKKKLLELDQLYKISRKLATK